MKNGPSIGKCRHRGMFEKRTIDDNTSPQYPGWQERFTAHVSVTPLSVTQIATLGKGDYVIVSYEVAMRTPQTVENRPRAGDRLSMISGSRFKYSTIAERFNVVTVAEHPRRRRWLQIRVNEIPS